MSSSMLFSAKPLKFSPKSSPRIKTTIPSPKSLRFVSKICCATIGPISLPPLSKLTDLVPKATDLVSLATSASCATMNWLEFNPSAYLALIAAFGLVTVFYLIKKGLPICHDFFFGGDLPYERSVFGAFDLPFTLQFVIRTLLQMYEVLMPSASKSIAILRGYSFLLTSLWFLDRWKGNVLRNTFESMTPMGPDDKLLLNVLSSAGSFLFGGLGLSLILRLHEYYFCFLGFIGGASVLSFGKDVFLAVVYMLRDMIQDHSRGDPTMVNAPPK